MQAHCVPIHCPGPGQTARALQVLSEAELNKYFLYKKFYITLCKVKNQINWQEWYQRDKLQAQMPLINYSMATSHHPAHGSCGNGSHHMGNNRKTNTAISPAIATPSRDSTFPVCTLIRERQTLSPWDVD